MAADPFFSNTVLLLHLDGADGANTTASIVDDSAAHHVPNVVVNGSLTTAQKKWGTASLQCTGANGAYISYVDHADWNLGAGQFTIELWARRTAAISGVRTLISQWGGAGNFGWQLAFNGTVLAFYYSTTGSDNPTVQGNYTPTLNDWDFFAVDRDASNNVRVYAGTPAGISVIAGPTSVPATIFNSTASMVVGNDGTNTRGWPGQIDDIRITKGVARYAGTCPVPTEQWPGATDPIVDVAGVAREVLLSAANPALANAGLVREVLLSSLTSGLVAGVVREVLLSTPPVVLGGQTAVSRR
jgi:hypothetical protein